MVRTDNERWARNSKPAAVGCGRLRWAFPASSRITIATAHLATWRAVAALVYLLSGCSRPSGRAGDAPGQNEVPAASLQTSKPGRDGNLPDTVPVDDKKCARLRKQLRAAEAQVSMLEKMLSSSRSESERYGSRGYGRYDPFNPQTNTATWARELTGANQRLRHLQSEYRDDCQRLRAAPSGA